MIVWGPRTELGVFMENEKFKQCFEDILNDDYLNVVLSDLGR